MLNPEFVFRTWHKRRQERRAALTADDPAEKIVRVVVGAHGVGFDRVKGDCRSDPEAMGARRDAVCTVKRMKPHLMNKQIAALFEIARESVVYALPKSERKAPAMSIWTEQERDRVAELLKEGLPARRIAEHFPGKTRNSIIGVVGRDKRLKAIGFQHQSNCPPASRPKEGGAPRVTRLKPRVSRQPVPEGDMHCVGRPLDALPTNHCRYAVNEAARGAQHLFCGAPSDGSWCTYHRVIVSGKQSRLNEHGIAA